jgi:hypothetical protein
LKNSYPYSVRGSSFFAPEVIAVSRGDDRAVDVIAVRQAVPFATEVEEIATARSRHRSPGAGSSPGRRDGSSHFAGGIGGYQPPPLVMKSFR